MPGMDIVSIYACILCVCVFVCVVTLITISFFENSFTLNWIFSMFNVRLSMTPHASVENECHPALIWHFIFIYIIIACSCAFACEYVPSCVPRCLFSFSLSLSLVLCFSSCSFPYFFSSCFFIQICDAFTEACQTFHWWMYLNSYLRSTGNKINDLNILN